jgi:hypothetical protein
MAADPRGCGGLSRWSARPDERPSQPSAGAETRQQKRTAATAPGHEPGRREAAAGWWPLARRRQPAVVRAVARCRASPSCSRAARAAGADGRGRRQERPSKKRRPPWRRAAPHLIHQGSTQQSPQRPIVPDRAVGAWLVQVEPCVRVVVPGAGPCVFAGQGRACLRPPHLPCRRRRGQMTWLSTRFRWLR